MAEFDARPNQHMDAAQCRKLKQQLISPAANTPHASAITGVSNAGATNIAATIMGRSTTRA
jgi:hypothetical protein